MPNFTRRSFFKGASVLFLASLASPRRAPAAEGDAGKKSGFNPKPYGASPMFAEIGKRARIVFDCPKEFSENPAALFIGCKSLNSRAPGGGFIRSKLGTEEVKFESEGGKIFADMEFSDEREYVFTFYNRSKVDAWRAKTGPTPSPAGKASIYALNPDLFATRPYKGDMHMHSTWSDGRQPPEEVGLKCLETGYDFQALSDHRKYEASERLIGVLSKYSTSMACFKAEEVHTTSVHIHSIGASRSMTLWAEENPEELERLTQEFLKSVPKGIEENERVCIAKTEATWKMIRECGGIAVFNHLYWRQGDRRYVSDAVRDTLLERKNFDAIELANRLCGSESTDLTEARRIELLEKGIKYPIIGNSDAHRTFQIGGSFTIAFSKSKKFVDVKDAILNFRSVVVETVSRIEFSNDETADPDFKGYRIIGPRRLVALAHFVMRNFYPEHDALCEAEAEILRPAIEAETELYKRKTPADKLPKGKMDKPPKTPAALASASDADLEKTIKETIPSVKAAAEKVDALFKTNWAGA